MTLRFKHRSRQKTQHGKSFPTQSDTQTIPLSCLCEGQEGEIARLEGGRGMTQRLAEMGLTPGVKVKVMRSCAFGGPIEIEVRNMNLALGRGVAARIFVKPFRNSD